MMVLDPGHLYMLAWLDGNPSEAMRSGPDVLQFVKRVGEQYPGNEYSHPGTTIQEVLRACIDRIEYLDQQVPHTNNGYAIQDLRSAINWLEQRAAERHGRRWQPPMVAIELLPTCPKCLHIGCRGECHP